jgi:hypothetical protein
MVSICIDVFVEFGVEVRLGSNEASSPKLQEFFFGGVLVRLNILKLFATFSYLGVRLPFPKE